MKFTLVLVVALGCLYQSEARIKISAFNIQVFGVTKMSKPHVVEVLINILNRYDVTLIQEIRDASQTAIYDLLDQVNARAGSDGFSMILSARLGRTSSKEQYAWFYRPTKMSVQSTYQFTDPQDIFERPPMTVKFYTPGESVRTWSYLGIHVKPTDAVSEIDAMTDVYDEVSVILGTSNMLLGGDFNAACSYVPGSAWARIRLRSQSRFMWLIGDNVDTTLANSRCAYDRLVLAGSTLQNAYVSGTATAFNYWQYYGLTETHAKEVSDHYPVIMEVN